MQNKVKPSLAKTKSTNPNAPVLAIGHGGANKKKRFYYLNCKTKVGASNQCLKRKFKSQIVLNTNLKEVVCFYNQQKGQWRHSFPEYQEDTNKNKAKVFGMLGIFMIKLYILSTFNSWVLDTGYGTHIC